LLRFYPVAMASLPRMAVSLAKKATQVEKSNQGASEFSDYFKTLGRRITLIDQVVGGSPPPDGYPFPAPGVG
jgi:hypothetical protein